MRRLAASLSLGVLLGACTEEVERFGVIEVSTERIEFGTIQVGATAFQSVAVTNVGEAQLRLLSVSVVEGDLLLWEVDQQGAPTLQPGESTEIVFRFSPVEPGQQVARARIRNSSQERPELDIELAGATEISNDDLDGDGYSPEDGDCDDDNRLTYPGAEEICDGRDNDCDGQIDPEEADVDSDGYRVCEGDCDDEDATVRPGRTEICDGGKDTDCDGIAQDYLDEDEDGWSLCASDCDDSDPNAHPTREEVCDGIDNDCNDNVDDIDRDGDGRGACPGAGDCDDTDPSAYGQVVDAFATEEGDGSTDLPFTDILDAINAVDDICRTVVIRRGSYEVSRTWSDGYLRIEGAGTYPDEVLISPPTGSGYRIFTVREGSILELSNLLLRQAQVDGDGSALHITDSDLVLEDVVLFNNSVSGRGGAIYAEDSAVSLNRVQLTGNQSGSSGGAMALVGSDLSSQDVTWEGNSGESGGALWVNGGAVAVTGGLWSDNVAALYGGAMDLERADSLSLEGATLTLNSAGSAGGAVWAADLDGAAQSRIRRSVFQDNAAASDGGAVAIGGTAPSLLIANNTFAGDAADGGGGAIHVGVADGSDVYVWSNLIVSAGGNESLFAGAGASVGWNAVHGSATTPWTLDGAVDAGGNTTDDPLLATFSNDGDPGNDDLTLQAGSPAIDSGPPEGTSAGGWTAWLDADGTDNDRGAGGGPAVE